MNKGIIAFICLDDNNGILFNKRRQSQDRVVRKKIMDIVGDGILCMSPYSTKMFSKDGYSNVKAVEGVVPSGFYFFESGNIPYEYIRKLYVFRWNRVYPFDERVDIGYFINNFNLVQLDEMKGSSHEKVTVEVFER